LTKYSLFPRTENRSFASVTNSEQNSLLIRRDSFRTSPGRQNSLIYVPQ